MSRLIMLFVIRFVDNPNMKEVREQYLDAHISWLAERRQSILIAGSLRVEPNSHPIGAFWVVEAESKVDVKKLFVSDPFWMNGLRESVEILHWSKAFEDEQTFCSKTY